MNSRLALWLVTVLALGIVHAQDAPPSLMWAREYFQGSGGGKFIHVIEASTGGFIVAGWDFSSGPATHCVYRMDADGDIVWSWDPGYYSEGGDWVLELENGDIIVTGFGKPTQATGAGALLACLSQTGSTIWVKCYPATSSETYCIEALPDGGYAACGAVNTYYPWLLRTDSQGDTLWTRVWQTGWARARRVVYYNAGLTVFVDGGYGYGPLILRYDMDGNLEWASDFTGEFPTDSNWGGSLCLTPGGGGYTFVSDWKSWIVGTNEQGVEDWRQEVAGTSGRLGLSIDPTMDGGYVFSGRGGYWGPPDAWDMHTAPADTGTTWDGWLVKMDSLGQHQWHVFNSQGPRDNYFNSVCQLSQGGYMVAGQIRDASGGYNYNAYLLRYAPETGIEGGEPSPVPLSLLPSSNPFSSSVTIACDGDALPGQLMVYDITGRLIRSLSDREGSSFTWDGRDGSGADAPTGTYLILGAVDGQVSSIRVVRL